MARLRKPITIATLLCALACARWLGAQTSDALLSEPVEPASQTQNSQPEEIPPGTEISPAPAPMERLPDITSDNPVPYYSRLWVADDIPRFSPNFELSPREVKLGLIAAVELDYVKPFIHNGLNSAAPVGNLPINESISAPTAQPQWGAMPRVDFGYRFEQGLGELHAIFRFLNVQGNATPANFDAAGAGSVNTRLNVDVLDLDYAFTEFNPGRVPRIPLLAMIPGRWGLNLRPEDDPYPMFRMKWAFGARLANVFFASQGAGQQILHERVTNNFVGAGIHAAVDFSKPLPRWTALGVYARFEAAGLYGDTTQSFTRTEVVGGSTVSGSALQRDINAGVPVLDATLGLSFTPEWRNNALRLTSGYRFEQWWYLGETSTSSAALTMQGVFFRGEFGY